MSEPEKNIDDDRPEDDSLDKVEKDFNREKRMQHLKETLWQNKRVRFTMIAMSGLLMISYFAWVISK